jgi:DNA-binding MarR family transcriptional regulator
MLVGGSESAMEPINTSPRSAEGLAELIEHLLRQLHGASFVAGLNPAQWSALRFFKRANPSARTLTAFVKFHAATKGSAAQTLGALRKKKLVHQRPSSEDGRVRYYELTALGEQLLREDPILPFVRAIQTLPADETSDLARGLQAVVQAWMALSSSTPRRSPLDV